MSLPPEITGVDPTLADPSLQGAPLAVRKAGAWLAQQAPHRRSQQISAFGALGLFFAAFPVAGIVATLAHSEPVGLLAMLAVIAVSALLSWRNWRKWGKTTTWASSMIVRWKQLEELGIPADLAPDGEGTASALERMVGRIEALAGPDHQAVRDAATRALARARRLEGELAHLEQIATGQPDADTVLDAARERILTELARTRARVAEVYAGLVELEAGQGADDELGQAVARVAAELEVDDQADAARRARAQRQQVGQ